MINSHKSDFEKERENEEEEDSKIIMKNPEPKLFIFDKNDKNTNKDTPSPLKKALEIIPKKEEDKELKEKLNKLAFDEEDLEKIAKDDEDLKKKEKEIKTTLYLVEEFRCSECLNDEFLKLVKT